MQATCARPSNYDFIRSLYLLNSHSYSRIPFHYPRPVSEGHVKLTGALDLFKNEIFLTQITNQSLQAN